MTAPDPFLASPLGSTAPDRWDLQSIRGCEVETIGQSRQGRALFGLSCGRGPTRVSITAGAHADEPVGPRTAVMLAAAVAEEREPWAQRLAETCTFRICPDVNPDGDAANAAWQQPNARGHLVPYLIHARREPPGDDVEFHYPRSEDDEGARPENRAVAAFLRRDGDPFAVHASLHSMGVAEGAQFLVCREWVERCRAAGMFERLAHAAGLCGLGLHDTERHGEKGFHRLAPGLNTTPRADAMEAFFLGQGDAATAALFRPSSMDFVQGLGGDPLCIVSELPFFEMRAARSDASPPERRPYFTLRKELPAAREALVELGDEGPLRELVGRYGIVPVPWEVQRKLQLAFVLEAIRVARGEAPGGAAV